MAPPIAASAPAGRRPGRGEYACACGAAACFFFGTGDEAQAKAWCFPCAPAEFKPGRAA